MAQPMLGEIELRQVQALEGDEHLVTTQHAVPALEGDFLQRHGRPPARMGLEGVLSGPDAREGVARLQEQFRAAQFLPFVADIATATRVGEVLIETLDVRELAGHPERFAYAVGVLEVVPPPAPETVPPEIIPPRPASVDTGTLVVEVTVEGQPDFEFAAVALNVERTDGATAFSRALTAREANVWTEEGLPPGQYRASALVTAPLALSGSAAGAVRTGQLTRVAITLTPGAAIATTFVVHFRFDKAFVEPCMRVVLRQVRQHARTHPDEKVLIVGHTDKTGSDAYNQSLSERRARAVFAFLTVGRDAAATSAALAEWNQLRLTRPPGELPTIKDNWGLREAQHMLQDLNFYPGNVDGRDGPLTQEAIKAFRCQHGLPPGTTMDDATWQKLIEAYLAQDSLSIPAIPEGQFQRNAKDACDGGVLKWIGCGEQDPVRNVLTAERRNRRTEILFVRASALPCAVPQPDTFNLPTAGAVGSTWCLGPGDPSARCCFVFAAAPQPNAKPRPDQFVRTPAQPDKITVTGSITRETRRPDGTVEFVPVPNQRFVLITPDGEFLAGEQSNGDPQPARTDADGRFEFRDKPSGVYAIEVVAPVLVRRELQSDEDVRGNATCGVLRPGKEELNVVIIDAPVMREIRLPTAVRLMAALHPATRAIRLCTDPRGRTDPQATAHSAGDARDLFDGEDGPDVEGVNKIWRQARVRFRLDDADIVSEAHAFRTDCEIDSSEFAMLLERCAYHNAINVFLVGDLSGDGGSDIGGLFLRIATPAPRDTAHGCTVSDRRDFIGIRMPMSRPQTVQALAHELGHYLDLGHVADPDRLMLDGLISGANRRLIGTEVDRARASEPAALECLPLKLRVTGASRVGGPLSDHFLAVQDPAGVVTVDAEISAALIDPTVGNLTMVGGTPGAGPLQATVSTAGTGVTEIFAIYTPTRGGRVVKARALIRVVAFDLRVDGATQVGGAGSRTFVARREPGMVVTIIAELDPAPFCVPRGLVTWDGGDEAPDPLRRIVSKDRAAQTTVKATLAGTTLERTITIIFVALVEDLPPFETIVERVQIEGVQNRDLASGGGSLAVAEVLVPLSLFRARADIPGIAGPTLQAFVTTTGADGTLIERFPVTLRRTTGDQFLSRPILAVPAVFQRSQLSTVDCEAVRAQARGELRFDVPGSFGGLTTARATVRGRIVRVFAQAFAGSGVTAADIRRHLRVARETWAQAGIDLQERDARAAVADPGGLLELERGTLDPATGRKILSNDERRLVGLLAPSPLRSSTPSDINMYYVLKIDGAAAGTTYSGELSTIPTLVDPDQTTIAIEFPDAPGVTALAQDKNLAHEIGHALFKGWGDEHLDLAGSPWPSSNVMHDKVSEGTDLDPSQVQNILVTTDLNMNPFVKIEP